MGDVYLLIIARANDNDEVHGAYDSPAAQRAGAEEYVGFVRKEWGVDPEISTKQAVKDWHDLTSGEEDLEYHDYNVRSLEDVREGW